ncbi:MAG: MFS transporter [Syntrophobacterales bacterium]|jgi:YNFM family putative membrane transporter|nr:MFS transporter [Syntrophobacterales bacterium]
MDRKSFFTLQALVFGLVAAALTTVYITQPVLPVLQREFGVSPSQASYTVSAVILGIALANLPFGMLADRFPVQRLILVGGAVVAACGLFCAATPNLGTLVGARFIQGLFVPSLTTCLAAYLSTNLPLERLNVVMGSYVSATVAGGLGGRLLGGFIHPPLHWRYAFVTASLLVVMATLAAVRWLPPGRLPKESGEKSAGFLALLSQPELRRIFLVAFGGFFVFSSIFNYLPFYLHQPPFNASTEYITLLYLTYIIGIFIGPMAGQLSNRIGNGGTMVLGALVFGLAIALTLIQSIVAIVIALMLVCGGFFSIHASAAGSLNRRLTSSRGRANSLYVLAYYLGGAVGITLSGYAYGLAGWHGVAALGLLMLAVPLSTGIQEMREPAGKGKPKEELSPGV